MNPKQIAKTSEHSHQAALFCFAAKAEKYGFGAAFDMRCYGDAEYCKQFNPVNGIPELKWLHAIPNGGSRGDTAYSRAKAGGEMKAEGVKSGVMDIFWPYVKSEQVTTETGNNIKIVTKCGLYIEMKSAKGKLSDSQKEFGDFVYGQGFQPIVCYTWQEAAQALLDYYIGELK